MINDYFKEIRTLSIQKKQFFKNYFSYARKIKEITKGEVIVFGSILEEKETMASDIDLLVVLESLKQGKREEIMSKIISVLGYYHPFEIHLVDQEGKKWYMRFIKNFVIV